jgi:hypothetical protein
MVKLVNTTKLKIAMLCSGKTTRTLADSIGMSYLSMNSKLLNRGDFKSQEVYKIAKALNLSKSEIINIFYNGYGENDERLKLQD